MSLTTLSGGTKFVDEKIQPTGNTPQCNFLKKLKENKSGVEPYLSRGLCANSEDRMLVHACIFHNRHLNSKLSTTRSPVYISLDENELLYALHTQKDQQLRSERIDTIKKTLLDKERMYIVEGESGFEFISLDKKNNLSHCKY